MKIFVRTLKGQTLEVQGEQNESISSLKSKVILQDPQYANFHLDFIFGGRVLSDTATVGNEKLKENCSLHLLVSELPNPKEEIDISSATINSKNSSSYLQEISPFGSASPGKSPMLVDSPPKNLPSPDSYIVTGQRKVNYHSSEIQLFGSRWNIRGFNNGKVNFDEGKMGQSIYIQDCLNSHIQITSKKVAHILIDRCTDSTIEFNSVIASVEIVNCKNTQIKCHGRIPLVQVDLTQNLTFHLNSKMEDITNIKFVNASCADIYVLAEAFKFQVPTSLLQDQMASKISFQNSQFKLKTLHSNSMTKDGVPNLSLLDAFESPLVSRHA